MKETKSTKKRSTITGLLDALEQGRPQPAEKGNSVQNDPENGNPAADTAAAHADNAQSAFDNAAMRLGKAMLRRLNVSEDEGSGASALVDSILGYWEKEPSSRSIREETMKDRKANQIPANETAPLPRPIRADITEAPETDYENMSSEQFGKLKKQLQRAALNGRRIRL